MGLFFTWFLSPLLEKGEVNGTSTMVPWSLPCFISTTREGRSYLYLEVPVATQARNRTTPKTTLTIMSFFLQVLLQIFSSVFFFSFFSERKGQVVKSARSRMHFSSCLLVHLETVAVEWNKVVGSRGPGIDWGQVPSSCCSISIND